MKSKFLVFVWLILLQVGFVSQMKGQYEDILCAPCVLEFINNYNSVIITQMEDAIGNQCDLYKIEGNSGQLTVQYVEEYDPSIGCYVPDLSPFSCQLDGSIIYQENIDGSPNCNTNHTNFTSYSGSLKDFTLPTTCQDYPLKEEFNLGEQIRLYTHIKTNEDALTHDKLIRITYQDGTILQNFYSYNGFQLDGSPIPSPINQQPNSCSFLYYTFNPNQLGIYTVENYVIYTDGSIFNYETYNFEVKDEGPEIPTFTDVTPPSWNSIVGGCDAQVGDIDNNGFLDIVFNHFDFLNKDGVFIQSGNFWFERDGSLIDIDKDGKLNYLNDHYYLSDFNNTGANILLKGKRTSSNCRSNTFTCTFYNPLDEACSASYFDQLIGFNGNENEKFSTLPADWNNDKNYDLIVWDTIYNIDDFIPLSKLKLPIKLFEHSSADMDNDGKIDIVNSPINDNPLQILMNNLSLTILNRNTWGQIFTADVNNDGEMDILNEGVYFKHKDELKFEFFKDLPNLPNDVGRIVKPIDYDNDGDIDLFFPHIEGLYAKLYCNNSTKKNSKPNRPQNPEAIVLGNRVDFSWTNGGDDLTAYPTYNLYVKNLTTNNVIYFPHSDTLTGQLRLLEKGNCEYNTGWFLQNLSPGRYRWKVQAVDQGFLGSEWAEGEDFVIIAPECDTEIEMVQGVTCILPKVISTGQILLECENNTNQIIEGIVGKKYKIGYIEHQGCISTCQEGLSVSIQCVEQTCVFSEINITHTSCGRDNGSITLSNINGCTYKWPDGMETNTRTNLSAGDYKITLMPSIIDTVITINSSNSLNVGNPILIQPNCGLANGSIELPLGNGYTYDWGSNNTQRVRNNLSPGTYQVTISDGVCNDIRNIILSTSSGLNANFTNDKQPTCGQSNGKITLNTGSVGYSYLWNESSISGTAPENLKANTDYRVTITRTSDECKDTLDVTLTDYIPSASIQASRLLINCTNDTPIQLSVQSETEDLYNNLYQINKFEWSNGSSDPLIIVKPSEITTYTLTITDENGCTATAEKIITVNKNKPISSISSQDQDTVITCKNTKLNLEASSDALNPSYRWIQGISGNQKNVQVSNPGTYVVEVANTNNGCKDTVSINIGLDTISPVYTIKYDSLITCKDSTSEITLVNTNVSNYTYEWNNNIVSNKIIVSEKGNYTVTVTDINNGCSNQRTVTIQEDKNVPSAPDFDGTLTCKNPDTLLIVSRDPKLPIKLSLMDGSPFKDSITYNDATAFTIVREFIHNGCKYEMDVVIIIDTTQIAGAVCEDGKFIQSDCECRPGCSQLKIKDDHMINPNLPGIGGFLSLPITSVFDQNKLTIMNRWGQKVYEKSPYISTDDEGWRGTFMDTGEPLPDGAYYYQLILTPEDKTCRFAGSVTVVR